MRTLSSAVAVITGAGSGIGRALAQELSARGASLALADLSLAKLEYTRSLLKPGIARAYVVDVSEAAAMANFASEVERDYGKVSLLINNAGVALYGKFSEVAISEMSWLMNTNFWGVVHGCKFFIPLLEREPEAHIVNLSSLFGLIAQPGQSGYCASKFAVRGFTEVLRHELKGTHIGVTCVHPGGVKTAIARSARSGVGADAGAAAVDAKHFEKLSPTTPEFAALKIVQGVLSSKSRVLIGADAVKADWLQRCAPTIATSVFAASLKRKASR